MELTVEDSKGHRTAAKVSNQPATSDDNSDHSLLVKLRLEVDGYYKLIAGFADEDPVEVMRAVSAIGARMTYLRAAMHRRGSTRCSAFRTQEIDPLIEALKLQFQIHSRIVSVHEFEYKVSKGEM